jgi:sigma54-dependent transcription regulator
MLRVAGKGGSDSTQLNTSRLRAKSALKAKTACAKILPKRYVSAYVARNVTLEHAGRITVKSPSAQIAQIRFHVSPRNAPVLARL